MPRAVIGGVQPNTIASLAGWFKADAITGLSDGQALTTWNDSSVNGNNIAPSIAAPIYKINQINGLPIVRFTRASSQRLLLNGPIGLTSQNFSLFFVFKVASQGTYRTFLVIGDGNGGRKLLISASNQFDLHKANVVGMGPGNFIIPDTTTFRIAFVSYQSPAINFKVNGNPDKALSNAQTFTDAAPVLAIGYDYGGVTDFFDGDIAEILIFSEVLSEVNRINMEQYLAKKYNAFGITTSRTLVS